MNTRGAPEPITTPSSPSSRANEAPTDSESQVASPEVVDTATSARRVSDPPPLRPSKRATPKPAVEGAQVKACKGKKMTTKCVPPSVARRATRAATQSADSDCEEKAPPPIAKMAKTTLTSPSPMPKSTPVPRGTVISSRGQGFDLSEFMESFQPGSATATSSADTGNALAQTTPASREVSDGQADGDSPSVLEELRALKADVLHLCGLVGAQGAIGGSVLTRTAATAPNAKGELPPAEVCHLTTHSFPESSKKAKGDYNHPQAHTLAASRMFRSFRTATGKPLSAMSYVLWMRSSTVSSSKPPPLS
ncbi:Hypothetical protein PHPALM_20090 [Phytophthora palmivora]|uniref:Uncharacterized protein n=1 Tax=Phytophthora palmivora TaxID=4796 RepID=A0A2P4XFQ6_9STRA|nr:Hypothetical protein PHPALM_20090 [Phytophthora palmivora]